MLGHNQYYCSTLGRHPIWLYIYLLSWELEYHFVLWVEF